MTGRALVALALAIAIGASPAAAHAADHEGVRTSRPGVTAQDGQLPVDRLLHDRLHDSRLGRNVAMLVIDADTGAVLSAHHPRKPMQGASNMKILTAVNAIATLGPDRRFPTALYRDVEPGHLILLGSGDPVLTPDEVGALARLAAPAITGPVVVHPDAGLFDAPTPAPGWVEAYQGSSIGMVQSLTLRGDRSPQPADAAAEVVIATLKARGIEATLGTPRGVPAGAELLASTPGHSVAESIAVMLRESDSAVAEVLFRLVAIAQGQPPTWAGGQAAAMQTLQSLGIDLTGAQLVDGSGLSRDDRISPRLVADVLRLAAVTDPGRFAAIFAADALPTAGRTGTLTRAYGRYSTRPSSCARGLVRAKTGTILSTIALSGLARTVFGTRRIFSIIVNDRPTRYPALSTRQAVDGLAATVTGCWR